MKEFKKNGHIHTQRVSNAKKEKLIPRRKKE